MVIFTLNQYMKHGIEEMCKQGGEYKNTEVIIFDYRGTLVFLEPSALYLNPERALCDALTSCFHFNFRSGDSLGRFRLYLDLWEHRSRRSPPQKLTFSEEKVIQALLLGYSIQVISVIRKENIKTLSVHKTNALRKMGVRNLQTLYLMVQYWKRQLNFFNIKSDRFH